MNDWFEEVGKGISIALLAGGTVQFLSTHNGSNWSFGAMLMGAVGLTVIAIMKKKRSK